MQEPALLCSWRTKDLAVRFGVPTIFCFDAFRVMIYTNDHEPAHVHVIAPGKLMIFNLGDGSVALRSRIGVTGTEEKRARAFLVEHLAALWSEWRSLHGGE